MTSTLNIKNVISKDADKFKAICRRIVLRKLATTRNLPYAAISKECFYRRL
ncbi:MAG: hypothetical protein LBM19_00240 [Holosporales bacterium]|nr:hypothetical protein [Holosporales bacterium]